MTMFNRIEGNQVVILKTMQRGSDKVLGAIKDRHFLYQSKQGDVTTISMYDDKGYSVDILLTKDAINALHEFANN